jgi:hypothetical protein
MRGVGLLALCGLLFACSCSPAQSPRGGQSAGGENTMAQSAKTSENKVADKSQPLGEFEPLSAEDVQLYLKVMRTAAERLKNLPPADREIIKAFRKMTTNPDPARLPTPEQMKVMQRAPELMTMDATVARELGVSRRYGSVSGRIGIIGMPTGGGSGDDEPMTPEQRAQLKLRIQKFAELRRLDEAAFAAYREEIGALQKQVNLMMHPENIPQ